MGKHLQQRIKNHTAELNRTRVINGKDVLTADVHIVRHKDDNILTSPSRRRRCTKNFMFQERKLKIIKMK